MTDNIFATESYSSKEMEDILNDPLVLDALESNKDLFEESDTTNPLEYQKVEQVDPNAAPGFGSQLVGAPKQLGRGLVKGTMGVIEGVGSGMQYFGNRMNKPIEYERMVPSEKAEVIYYKNKYMKEDLLTPEQAQIRAVNIVNNIHTKPGKPLSSMLKTGGYVAEKFWADAQKPWAEPGYISGKNVWDNPELLFSPTWWSFNTGSIIPSLGASVVPGSAAHKTIKAANVMLRMKPAVVARIAKLGGAITGGAAGGALEGSATYRAVIQQGGSEAEAARAAEFMFMFSSGLNTISMGSVLNKMGTSLKAKVYKRGIQGSLEGITEGLEEPAELASKLISKYINDEEMPEDIEGLLIESLKEGLSVALLSFGPGAATSVGDTDITTFDKELTKAKDKTRAANTEYKTAKKDLKKKKKVHKENIQYSTWTETQKDKVGDVKVADEKIKEAELNTRKSEAEVIDQEEATLAAKKKYEDSKEYEAWLNGEGVTTKLTNYVGNRINALRPKPKQVDEEAPVVEKAPKLAKKQAKAIKKQVKTTRKQLRASEETLGDAEELFNEKKDYFEYVSGRQAADETVPGADAQVAKAKEEMEVAASGVLAAKQGINKLKDEHRNNIKMFKWLKGSDLTAEEEADIELYDVEDPTPLADAFDEGALEAEAADIEAAAQVKEAEQAADTKLDETGKVSVETIKTKTAETDELATAANNIAEEAGDPQAAPVNFAKQYVNFKDFVNLPARQQLKKYLVNAKKFTEGQIEAYLTLTDRIVAAANIKGDLRSPNTIYTNYFGVVERVDAEGTGEVENMFNDMVKIIRLFNGSNISTLAHETGHILTKIMYDLRSGSNRDYDYIADFVGAKRDSNPVEWTDDQHEVVAKAFEKYLKEGVAPVNAEGVREGLPEEAMESVFEKFRTWLYGIYTSIKYFNDSAGNEIIPTPEVISLFDSYFNISRARVRQINYAAMAVFDSAMELDTKEGVITDPALEAAKKELDEKTEITETEEAVLDNVFGTGEVEAPLLTPKQAPSDILEGVSKDPRVLKAMQDLQGVNQRIEDETESAKHFNEQIPFYESKGAPSEANQMREAAEKSEKRIKRLVDRKGKLEDIISGKAEDRVLRQIIPEDVVKESDIDVIRRYNINYGDLKDASSIHRLIETVQKEYQGEINEVRRDKMTEAGLIELARDLDVTPADLLNLKGVGNEPVIWSAERSIAMHSLLAKVSEDVIELAKAVVNPVRKKSPLASFNFERALEAQLEIEAAILQQRTETGRLFRTFQMPIDAMASKDMKIKQLQDRVESRELLGKGSTEKLANLILEASENKSTRGKMDAVKGVQKARKKAGLIRRTWDWFMQVYINGLLSSPLTHMRNFISNEGVSMYLIPERYLGAMNGWARKTKDQFFNAEKVNSTNYMEFGEANQLAYGWFEGALGGLKIIADVLPDTLKLKDLPAKYQSTLKKGEYEEVIKGKLGKVVSLPGAFLELGDLFFVDSKGQNGTMNRRALAHREASSWKKNNPSRTDAEFVARMEDMIENPGKYGLDVAAREESDYQTFRTKLTGSTKQVQAALNRSGVGRLVVPFMRTPWNIVVFGMERTPFLHFASKKWREDWAAGGPRRDLALAKAEIAYVVGSALVGLALNGLITGGGPEDPKEKAAFLRSGKKPYSMKIGGVYYSFQNFDPFAIPLGVAGSIGEIMPEIDDFDLLEVMTAFTFGFMENIINKNYLKTLSEFMDAIQHPDRYGERYWTNVAGNVVPFVSAERWASRIVDPVSRQTRNTDVDIVRGDGNNGFGEVWSHYVNKLKKNAPGFSKSLPPRLNLWGESITIDGGASWRATSPLYKSYEKHSAPDTEIMRLQSNGVDILSSMPADTINIQGVRVPLTAWEYNTYIKSINSGIFKNNRGIKETLDRLIKSKHYKRLNDEEKGDEINHYFKNAKKFGKNILIFESKYSKDIQKYVDEQIKAKQQGR